MRALFQILIGMATHSVVSSTASAVISGSLARKHEDAPGPAVADRLAQQLEEDRRRDEDHLPVDLEAAQQPPRVAMEVGEDERREVPDGVLGADLAQAAAGEAAADRERDGAVLPGEGAGQADHQADQRSGVGPGQEPGQERPGQDQVGGVVAEQDAGDGPGEQGNAERSGEGEPFRPVALLGQEQPPEAPEPGEHRGQRRHHGELRQHREDEELLVREEPDVKRGHTGRFCCHR